MSIESNRLINGTVSNAVKLQTPRKINGTAFDGTNDVSLNRYTGFIYVSGNNTYNASISDAEKMLQCDTSSIINLPASMPKMTTFTLYHCGASGTVTIQVPSGSFIYHPATGLYTNSTQLILQAGETLELLNRGSNEYDVVGGSYVVRVLFQNIATNSIQSGSAPYKKGWRKLSATLPSAAGEFTIAHGITTVETIQAKVTDSDGLIVFNNDPDPARQFYIRVNAANVVVGVGSSATKIFGKTVTIYAGEEL